MHKTLLAVSIALGAFLPAAASAAAYHEPIPFVSHPWDTRTDQARARIKASRTHAYPYYVKEHIYASPFRSQTAALHPVHRNLYSQGYVGGYLWNYYGNRPATFSQAGTFGTLPRSALRNPVSDCQNYGYTQKTWRVPYGYRCF